MFFLNNLLKKNFFLKFNNISSITGLRFIVKKVLFNEAVFPYVYFYESYHQRDIGYSESLEHRAWSDTHLASFVSGDGT